MARHCASSRTTRVASTLDGRASRDRMVREGHDAFGKSAFVRPSRSSGCGQTSTFTPHSPRTRGVITTSSLALKRKGRGIRRASFIEGCQTAEPAKQVCLYACTPTHIHTCAHMCSKHLPGRRACTCGACARDLIFSVCRCQFWVRDLGLRGLPCSRLRCLHPGAHGRRHRRWLPRDRH